MWDIILIAVFIMLSSLSLDELEDLLYVVESLMCMLFVLFMIYSPLIAVLVFLYVGDGLTIILSYKDDIFMFCWMMFVFGPS